MTREQQIEWEARWGRPAAAAAIMGILLPIVAGILQSSSLDSRPRADQTVEFLRLLDRQGGVFLTTAAVQALGTLVLAAVLAYLFRVVKFRRPALPTAALVLGLLGPLLLAAAAILDVLDRLDNADEFLRMGAQTEKRADDLLVERSGLTLGVGLAGTLSLAFALIATSLAAMRAGVVSRFLGFIGVILGVLYVVGQVITAFAPLVIQFFWLGAMTALFLGRWPGGRGPAWASGEPEPWPSQMEMARAREAQAQSAQPEPQEPAAAKPRRKKRR
ncbi:MAG: DUF4386 family protein [Actinomycetota bacterium]|nr:DUF4386 family protein [Actinomycetota bacterium]